MKDSIPRDGLVLEVLGNGDWTDTSGNGNDGTATNVTYEESSVGYQEEIGDFNGSSSRVTLPTTALDTIFNNTTEFSYSFWCNTDTPTVEQRTSLKGRFIPRILNSDFNVLIYNNGSDFLSKSAGITIETGRDYLVTITWKDNDFFKIYVDGVEVNSVACGTHSVSSGSGDYKIGSNIFGNNRFWNGNIGLVRIYNRALNEQEIQALHLEGLRRLGQNNYPSLFRDCVGIFECENGGQDLYNIIDGLKATRTGGTNTDDNFGISKGITNPNYSWTSLTYTNSYLRENSGSGRDLTKNDSNVSATGINKTTTFGRLYLFNRTLTSGEETTLETLSGSKYIYPRTKTSTPNLQDGLVLDINGAYSGTTYYDQSGNGNNGTGSNMIDGGRIGQHNIMEFNGSSSYTQITNDFSLSDVRTVSFWINNETSASTSQILLQFGLTGTNNNYIWAGIQLSNSLLRLYYMDNIGNLSSGVTIPRTTTNELKYVQCVFPGVRTANSTTGFKILVNGVEQSLTNGYEGFSSRPTVTGDTFIGKFRRANRDDIQYFDGQIFNVEIHNRELSDIELQQQYYRNYIQ